MRLQQQRPAVEDTLPPAPYAGYSRQVRPQSALRSAITACYRQPEAEAIARLLDSARLSPAQKIDAGALASLLAQQLRDRKSSHGDKAPGWIQNLARQFPLSSQEGMALLCLAEALPRIPDAATRDALIHDKTRKISYLARAVRHGCAPLLRVGIGLALRLASRQFIAGSTIQKALSRAAPREKQGFRYSYDLPGEPAMTDRAARDAMQACVAAIHAIGRAAGKRGIYEGPGISVRLSALHPRFTRSRFQPVADELYLRLSHLVTLARSYNIGINIDAGQADRLDLSLDLLEKLCFEPALNGWNGIGFTVQAYQKCCPAVIDFLIDLAHRSQRRLMVRLVKGAHWHSEIRRAQTNGLDGYPVFTQKSHTDIAYLACARRLLAEPAAVYPQFATHNTLTLAAIHTVASQHYHAGQYEFLCLRGVGEPLYESVVKDQQAGGLASPCRIHASIGSYRALLPYLARRLLENGTGASFFNRLADPAITIDALVADPVDQIEPPVVPGSQTTAPHLEISLPLALYGTARRNASGIDFSDESAFAALTKELSASADTIWNAAPVVGNANRKADAADRATLLRNPANRKDIVGTIHEATADDMEDALAICVSAGNGWRTWLPQQRAAVLDRAADIMETEMTLLAGLIIREAGMICANAIVEIRQAINFLRYYATQIRLEFSNRTHRALGPVLGIGPSSSPLAAFSGQIAAALASGNAVIARPAAQTPLIAARAVCIFHRAGIPRGVLQFLPGSGATMTAALAADPRIAGVVFNGSIHTAHTLQRILSGRFDAQGRLPVLIAETGGQNAMIVDSSAVLTQAIADILASAFDTAGQHCTALRYVFLQEDIADQAIDLLRGAMQELRIGPPSSPDADIGPVIDATSRAAIEAHIRMMRERGCTVFQLPVSNEIAACGTYVGPALIMLDDIAALTAEVFGPVLHVVRYRSKDLRKIIEQINVLGCSLGFGIHTRIDQVARLATNVIRAGNQYVNCNMTGGPRVAGPLYLRRLLDDCPLKTFPGSPEDADTDAGASRARYLSGLALLRTWLRQAQDAALISCCDILSASSSIGMEIALPGPAGERNTYRLVPRAAVLCVARDRGDYLFQLTNVLAAGSNAVWLSNPLTAALHASLTADLQRRVRMITSMPDAPFEAALAQIPQDEIIILSRAIAALPGPIVGLQTCRMGSRHPGDFSIERLMNEISLTVNTAAAGNNEYPAGGMNEN